MIIARDPAVLSSMLPNACTVLPDINTISGALTTPAMFSDFSVELLRPNFMLVSEGYPVKIHKNQWLLDPLSPPDIPWGATHQDIPPGT
jgi:hypothetical protein